MEFFSKVRERLHDELRADLDMQLRNSHQVREENEQWLMEKTPISDIFRGYYVTKVSMPSSETPFHFESNPFVANLYGLQYGKRRASRRDLATPRRRP